MRAMISKITINRGKNEEESRWVGKVGVLLESIEFLHA